MNQPITAGPRRMSRMVFQENLAGWLFLSANLIGYLLFRLLPILLSLFLSLSKWGLTSGLNGLVFVGLRNFKNLLHDSVFAISMENTLIFAFSVVPSVVLLALILAVIINDKIYAKSAVRLAFFLPYVSSMVAISVVWGMLYLDPFGPINTFLRHIGIAKPPGWLSSTKWALPAIIILSVWQMIGYNAVIILAGLQGIPASLYESADIDGANSFRKFLSITIPMLSPTLFFVIVVSIINSFQVFAPVNIMTQGGPGTATTVIVFYIYQTAFTYNEIGYASAEGWVLFIVVFAFTFLQWKLMPRDSYLS
jgi:multiple sugar transport system permease protein